MTRPLSLVLKSAAAASLVLCAVAVSQWVQSYLVGGATIRVPFNWDYEVRSREGTATLYRWTWGPPTWSQPNATPVGSVSLWVVAAITVVLPVASLRGWRTDWQARRRRLGGRSCLQCGYDLRESPTRCPECGTPAGMPPLPTPATDTERQLLERFEEAVAVGLTDLTPDTLGPPTARFLAHVRARPETHEYVQGLILAAFAAPHAAERVLQLCLHDLRWPALRSELKARLWTERNDADVRMWKGLLDAFNADWPLAEHYRLQIESVLAPPAATSPAPPRFPARG